MRYFFYIHSFVTYHVALEVIKYYKLDIKQCVLLLGNEFYTASMPKDVFISKLPYTNFPINSFAIKRKFWIGWGKLCEFDRYVESLSQGCKFHLFANQSGIDFIRLLISHKDCMSFSFLEEGMYSYYPAEVINNELCNPGNSSLFYKILTYLNFFGRLRSNKVYYSLDYDKVFGLTEDSFPNFREKVMLGNPFINSLDIPFSGGSILAFDALLNFGVINLTTFEFAVNKIFIYFKTKGLSEVWIKYHPEQTIHKESKYEIESLINKYKGEIVIKEMPQSFSVELIAGNSRIKNVDVYVFLSSVGLYAALCGRKVFSFANYIAELDSEYMSRVMGSPEIFKANIHFL